jgi:hypothetical protein
MSNYIPPTPPSRKNKKHNRKKVIPLPENCWVDQPDILPEFCRKIELSRGLFAIVDEEDVEFLNKFTWSVKPDGGTCYAVTNTDKTEYKMHRVVMKVNNGKEITIDHINHNGLDNRKSNLRIISRSENQLNRRDRTKDKNRFIGVLPSFSGNNFTAWIPLTSGKVKKNFDNEVIAARYYDYMMIKDKGPEIKTNLSKGRFTQAELDSFGGKVSNPLQQIEVAAGIKYQSGMVALDPLQFETLTNKIYLTENDLAAALKRVSLLEDTLRITETELKAKTNE